MIHGLVLHRGVRRGENSFSVETVYFSLIHPDVFFASKLFMGFDRLFFVCLYICLFLLGLRVVLIVTVLL